MVHFLPLPPPFPNCHNRNSYSPPPSPSMSSTPLRPPPSPPLPSLPLSNQNAPFLGRFQTISRHHSSSLLFRHRGIHAYSPYPHPHEHVYPNLLSPSYNRSPLAFTTFMDPNRNNNHTSPVASTVPDTTTTSSSSSFESSPSNWSITTVVTDVDFDVRDLDDDGQSSTDDDDIAITGILGFDSSTTTTTHHSDFLQSLDDASSGSDFFDGAAPGAGVSNNGQAFQQNLFETQSTHPSMYSSSISTMTTSTPFPGILPPGAIPNRIPAATANMYNSSSNNNMTVNGSANNNSPRPPQQQPQPQPRTQPQPPHQSFHPPPSDPSLSQDQHIMSPFQPPRNERDMDNMEGEQVGSGGVEDGPEPVPVKPENETEKFLMTAADQKDGTRDERLARVIRAKFEAGLLKPYNHVAGYTRLMRWMEKNMTPTSRQRTLQTLSEFRPAFRAVASSLTDLDLVFIEEAFERLLLDYDRVFSSMGTPACLWRRTGEIYKGNKEFAELVSVSIDQLKDGKLAIYELMDEDSAVNYWEKYGNIAFDASQKAVLTTCVLVNQSILTSSGKQQRNSNNSGTISRTSNAQGPVSPPEAAINCCFSFTIRRDSFLIPTMIVGNFLPIS